MNATILNPLFWIALAFGLYYFTVNKVWKKRFKYLVLILFFVFTNNWVSDLVLNSLEYETIKVNEITEPFQIGLVLGPFLDEDKYLPIRSESIRFTQAIQLYKQNKFEKFLLSGNDNPQLAKTHLIDLCVPPEDIILEEKSKNTHENALLSHRFLNQRGDTEKRILLITSASHMRRAKKCFDKVGLKVTPYSVDYRTSFNSNWSISLGDFIPNYRALRKWERIINESASTVFFKLKNYI